MKGAEGRDMWARHIERCLTDGCAPYFSLGDGGDVHNVACLVQIHSLQQTVVGFPVEIM